MANVSSSISSNPQGLEIVGSRQFTSWLFEQNLSLVFTTYQAGKVFFIGIQSTGQLSIFERTFNRCMGLWADASSLYISSLYQLWRFENALEPQQTYNGYDRLYVPQMSYVTGDLDIHDVTIATSPTSNSSEQSHITFVNTLFSCLATVSEKHSFKPLWKPPFISRLAAEDRCHLNGLALREGKPRYVTAISQSDVNEGWRDKRWDGGCIIDVESNAIALGGLSMPHSPRWYRDRLWVLNSGAGELGWVDLEKGTFEPITFCPGYLRGLAFWDDFAIVGLSKPRKKNLFGFAFR